ncbi:hypothetical protein [Marinoscillum sp. 108]|uniref:hypothetical protein n=1 Tax=Marinoscillum sp. 108 TaxID=2653151 RepID=UPI0012F0C91F|nr:hypothetical protein [Marinoscillum sp. 108]VXD19577.1 conserved hypothetical protein [Marinoscillum sp. 108]
MKSFGEIYTSISSNFEPQNRTLSEIGIILTKAYSVYKHPKFERFSPFTPGNQTEELNRTTVERLTWEIQQIKTNDNGKYIVASEGIERAIADIQTLNVYSLNPNDAEHFESIFNSAKMDANLKYLIEISRQGLLFTHQKNIQEHLKELPDKEAKLNYLNNTLFSLKQNVKLWDKKLYETLTAFLDVEVQKWEKFTESKESQVEFKSADQLHDFIVKLIKERLSHNIRYLEGYRVFWRDEPCQTQPKKENEIQPYIKSILKPYCDELGIRIVRENSVANGKIDITFSYLNFTICLEIKKAHHQDILTAINTQLTEYMIGEETQYGIYLILWYKSESGYNKPTSHVNIEELIGHIEIERDDYKYQIIGLDCTKPISPSKNK